MIIYYLLLFFLTNIITFCNFLSNYQYINISMSVVKQLFFFEFMEIIIITIYRNKENMWDIIYYALLLTILFWILVSIFFKISIVNIYAFESILEISSLFFLLNEYPKNILHSMLFFNLKTPIKNLIMGAKEVYGHISQLNRKTGIYNTIYKAIIASNVMFSYHSIFLNYIKDILELMVIFILLLSWYSSYENNNINNIYCTSRYDLLYFFISVILLVVLNLNIYCITNIINGLVISLFTIFSKMFFIFFFCKISLEGIVRLTESVILLSENTWFFMLIVLQILPMNMIVIFILLLCFFVGLYFSYYNSINKN